MANFWEAVKKNYEFIGYLILVVLLFVACFVTAFAWVAAAWIVILAIILRQETKVVGLILFLNCFFIVFHFDTIVGVCFFYLVLGALELLVCGLYLYRVFKKERKLNYKILIPIGLFIIYMMLPFHEWTFFNLIPEVVFLIFLYVIFEERKAFDFKYLVRCFAAGIIISCIFGLFKDVSPVLSERITTLAFGSKVRFQGLMAHPNFLSPLNVIAISALLILKYQNKITLPEFFTMFVPLFVFGYLTLSRGFILTVTAAMGVFALFDFVRRKQKALAFLGILLAVTVVVALVFFGDTQVLFKRIEDTENLSHFERYPVVAHSSVLDGKSEEWIQDLFAGEFRYDPGRAGLRELYLRDWSSSVKTIFLGRGVSRPRIGQMNTHNLFIRALWHHGLVGYVLYAAMILCAINWKKLKQVKRYLPVLIMVIPYLLIAMIETRQCDYVLMTLILAAIGFCEQLSEYNNTKPSD